MSARGPSHNPSPSPSDPGATNNPRLRLVRGRWQGPWPQLQRGKARSDPGQPHRHVRTPSCGKDSHRAQDNPGDAGSAWGVHFVHQQTEGELNRERDQIITDHNRVRACGVHIVVPSARSTAVTQITSTKAWIVPSSSGIRLAKGFQPCLPK